MNCYWGKRTKTISCRIISAITACAFFLSTVFPANLVYAQISPVPGVILPPAGTMVNPSPAFVPVMVKGLTVFPENPLEFDFIIDTGHGKLDRISLKEETTKLIKYFLATLTIPEDDVWVNLSPYEKDRIIPEKFGLTDMGKDLLAQDYLLKQLTASLMYPEDELGKKFWDRVYNKARAVYGTTEIPLNTFNKVWIVPDKAVIYEHENNAFIVESHLKVMLEEDYEAQRAESRAQRDEDDGRGITLEKSLVTEQDEQVTRDALNSQIIKEMAREIILPAIELEVNEGKTFASLRQIYHSMILATWYKEKLKNSLLAQVYADKSKTKGIDVEDPTIKEKIYKQYLEAFKKGVYDYIKEDYDPATQEIIPRQYFSGGFTTKSPSGKMFKSVITAAAITTAALLTPSQRASANEPSGQFETAHWAAVEMGTESADSRTVLASIKQSSTRSVLIEESQAPAVSTQAAKEINAYIGGLENGMFLFSLGVTGQEAAKQFGFSDGFARFYDSLRAKTQQRWDELKPGETLSTDDILHMAKELAKTSPQDIKPPQPFSETVKTELERWRNTFQGTPTPEAVDRSLQHFEEIIRLRINEPEVLEELAKAIENFNKISIPQGYLIRPVDFSDERGLILYKIDRKEPKTTLQGPVNVYYVSQVPEFPDSLLRGNHGWTPRVGEDYVAVFREAINREDITSLLNGENPFMAADPETPEGKFITRMSMLSGNLQRQSLSTEGFPEQKRTKYRRVREQYIRDNLVESVKRRRMLGRKDTGSGDETLEDALTAASSLVEAEDPRLGLGRLIMLAVTDDDSAWELLIRLAKIDTSSGIVSKLDVLDKLEGMQGLPADEWKKRIQKVYFQLDKEWRIRHGMKPDASTQVSVPQADVAAIGTIENTPQLRELAAGLGRDLAEVEADVEKVVALFQDKRARSADADLINFGDETITSITAVASKVDQFIPKITQRPKNVEEYTPEDMLRADLSYDFFSEGGITVETELDVWNGLTAVKNFLDIILVMQLSDGAVPLRVIKNFEASWQISRERIKKIKSFLRWVESNGQMADLEFTNALHHRERIIDPRPFLQTLSVGEMVGTASAGDAAALGGELANREMQERLLEAIGRPRSSQQSKRLQTLLGQLQAAVDADNREGVIRAIESVRDHYQSLGSRNGSLVEKINDTILNPPVAPTTVGPQGPALPVPVAVEPILTPPLEVRADTGLVVRPPAPVTVSLELPALMLRDPDKLARAQQTFDDDTKRLIESERFKEVIGKAQIHLRVASEQQNYRVRTHFNAHVQSKLREWRIQLLNQLVESQAGINVLRMQIVLDNADLLGLSPATKEMLRARTSDGVESSKTLYEYVRAEIEGRELSDHRLNLFYRSAVMNEIYRAKITSLSDLIIHIMQQTASTEDAVKEHLGAFGLTTEEIFQGFREQIISEKEAEQHRAEELRLREIGLDFARTLEKLAAGGQAATREENEKTLAVHLARLSIPDLVSTLRDLVGYQNSAAVAKLRHIEADEGKIYRKNELTVEEISPREAIVLFNGPAKDQISLYILPNGYGVILRNDQVGNAVNRISQQRIIRRMPANDLLSVFLDQGNPLRAESDPLKVLGQMSAERDRIVYIKHDRGVDTLEPRAAQARFVQGRMSLYLLPGGDGLILTDAAALGSDVIPVPFKIGTPLPFFERNPRGLEDGIKAAGGNVVSSRYEIASPKKTLTLDEFDSYLKKIASLFAPVIETIQIQLENAAEVTIQIVQDRKSLQWRLAIEITPGSLSAETAAKIRVAVLNFFGWEPEVVTDQKKIAALKSYSAQLKAKAQDILEVFGRTDFSNREARAALAGTIKKLTNEVNQDQELTRFEGEDSLAARLRVMLSIGFLTTEEGVKLTNQYDLPNTLGRFAKRLTEEGVTPAEIDRLKKSIEETTRATLTFFEKLEGLESIAVINLRGGTGTQAIDPRQVDAAALGSSPLSSLGVTTVRSVQNERYRHDIELIGGEIIRGGQDRFLNQLIRLPGIPHGYGILNVILDGNGGPEVAEFIQEKIAGIFRRFLKETNGDVKEAQIRTIKELHRLLKEDDSIKEFAKAQGSTISLAYISYDDARVYTANLGDSRIVIGNNTQKWVSPVHDQEVTIFVNGVKAKLAMNGVLGYTEADNLERNPYLEDHALEEGDFVLVFSDGLVDAPDRTIEDLIEENIALLRSNSETDAWELVQAALKRGSEDNITAIFHRQTPAVSKPSKAKDITGENLDIVRLILQSLRSYLNRLTLKERKTEAEDKMNTNLTIEDDGTRMTVGYGTIDKETILFSSSLKGKNFTAKYDEGYGLWLEDPSTLILQAPGREGGMFRLRQTSTDAKKPEFEITRLGGAPLADAAALGEMTVVHTVNGVFEPEGKPIVIYVEDDPEVRVQITELLQREFRKRGVSVQIVTVENYPSALQADMIARGILSSFQDLRALIISDGEFPKKTGESVDRTAGVRFLSYVANQVGSKPVPRILISGKDLPYLLRNSGINPSDIPHYLQKPFTSESLMSLISSLVPDFAALGAVTVEAPLLADIFSARMKDPSQQELLKAQLAAAGFAVTDIKFKTDTFLDRRFNPEDLARAGQVMQLGVQTVFLELTNGAKVTAEGVDGTLKIDLNLPENIAGEDGGRDKLQAALLEFFATSPGGRAVVRNPEAVEEIKNSVRVVKSILTDIQQMFKALRPEDIISSLINPVDNSPLGQLVTRVEALDRQLKRYNALSLSSPTRWFSMAITRGDIESFTGERFGSAEIDIRNGSISPLITFWSMVQDGYLSGARAADFFDGLHVMPYIDNVLGFCERIEKANHVHVVIHNDGVQGLDPRSEEFLAEDHIAGDLAVLGAEQKETKVGGINLNAELLDLQIKRDGNGVPLPLPQQPIQTMHIEGFIPVIINITPTTNLPLILGFAPTEKSPNPQDPSFSPAPALTAVRKES